MAGVAELSGSVVTLLPSREECQTALVRVTGSTGFKSAPRLVSFLRFIVDAVLSGRSDGLKAYTIAVGALGRSENFNPTTDAIVRVEAGRLRLALTRYYADEGSGEAIVIALPRGGYVPEFRWRHTAVVSSTLDVVAGLEALRRVRHRNSILHAEHREQRLALARNLEAFRVNMRALGETMDRAAAWGGAPAARPQRPGGGVRRSKAVETQDV